MLREVDMWLLIVNFLYEVDGKEGYLLSIFSINFGILVLTKVFNFFFCLFVFGTVDTGVN